RPMRAGSTKLKFTSRSSSARYSSRMTTPASRNWRKPSTSSADATPPLANYSPGSSPARIWSADFANPCFNLVQSQCHQLPDTGPGISGTDHLADGVVLKAGASGLLEDCEISQNNNGLRAEEGARPRIRSCRVHENRMAGVYIRSVVVQ